MKIFYKYLLLVLSGLVFINSSSAESLGRLFISPEDRMKLERIRYAKEEPEKIEIVKIEEIILPEVEEEKEEVINYDAITLKGLVYRKEGKSAAWINDSNTFEGDLESLYIQVDNDSIGPEQAQISMPDNATHINLKVGESYIPSTDE